MKKRNPRTHAHTRVSPTELEAEWLQGLKLLWRTWACRGLTVVVDILVVQGHSQ